MKTERPGHTDNFHNKDSDVDHHRRHGYNKTSFEYPIKSSSNLRDKFIKRMNGNFEISETIVPKFEDTHVCELHGNNYVPYNLIKVSPNIKTFTETSEFNL